jgi:hypothetical protein
MLFVHEELNASLPYASGTGIPACLLGRGLFLAKSTKDFPYNI